MSPLPVVVAEEDQEDDEKDEEGLLRRYDVIVCGTGLVQGLVAAALSRAGKSCLHLDGQEYYGELDAVWSLPYILQQKKHQGTEESQKDVEFVPSSSSNEHLLAMNPMGACASLQIHSIETHSRVEDNPLEIGAEVSTPFGIGLIKDVAIKESIDEADKASSPYASVAIALGKGIHSGSPMTLHVRIPMPDLPAEFPRGRSFLNYSALTSHKVVPLAAVHAQTILGQFSRSFALDITPALLYSGGKSVQALLGSQVTDYLEFKSLNGLLWYDDTGKLQKVPCSKADVFSSSLMSPIEKRRLMKFLQLALDYAVMEQEEDPSVESSPPSSSTSAAAVQSLNERMLNQGRSLPRPQNKALATTDLQKLQDCIAQNMTFDEYLKSHAKLSDSLTSVVQFALSLLLSEQHKTDAGNDEEPCATPLRTGMSALCRHMASLGKFGTTAFLYPLYGSGELPQAFCRSAAVYGATYLLRRPARAVVLNDDKKVVSIVIDKRNDNGEREGKEEVFLNNTCTTTKRVYCDHVVLPQQALCSRKQSEESETSSLRRVLRRISILKGKCLGGDPRAHQQQLVIFPPYSIDSKHPYAIQALLLDEYVKVSPHVPCGCTVVHLTSITSNANCVAYDNNDLLTKALQTLLTAASENSDNKACNQCQEIFHISFSYALDESSTQQDNDAAGTSTASGVHSILRCHVGVAQEEAFELAERIFGRICPEEEFMKVATKVAEKAIFQRHGDDDEQQVLETAMQMIQSSDKQKLEQACATEP